MALWKKKVNGWPPDDPPKGNQATNDSLQLYNLAKNFGRENHATKYISNTGNKYAFSNKESLERMKYHIDHCGRNELIPIYDLTKKSGIYPTGYYQLTDTEGYYPAYKKPTGNSVNSDGYDFQKEQELYHDSLTTYNNYNARIEYLIPKWKDPQTGEEQHKLYDESKKMFPTNDKLRVSYGDNILATNIINTKDEDVGQDIINSHVENFYLMSSLFKKPTGNSLRQQIPKIPIIKPELQIPTLKFKPPTPLPEGNVELQNTGYTTIGIKKKPDGTRFIYDRSGKTDKTVIIDDNRIGFEHYIKKLYE
jgi:hypothetical protein